MGVLQSADIYSTWTDSIEIRDAESDELVDLSDVTEVTLLLRDPISRFDELMLTLTNGDIVIPSTGIINWHASASAMGTLRPKLYKVIMLLENVDGDIVTVILGPISIIE